ncbi:glycosyl transferase [Salinimicrobium sp. CDJ15-81-2]|nr:glycosyl transferase [Salinimicrobium nanhaiense]
MKENRTVINVFKLDRMRYSPFDESFSGEHEYLKKNGINIISDVRKADIFICSSLKRRKFLSVLRNYKPILVWTNEPRSSTNLKNIFFPLKILFLNIYSGKVFVNNVTYQKKRFLHRPLLKYIEAKDLNVDFDRRTVALMSFYKGLKGNELKIKDTDVDLINLRNKIALYGHPNGSIDVYGQGWPEGISRENSRHGNWPETKRNILSHYNFNLAFENTVFPYYVTEKIWDAIENYCLPIYFGGKDSTIYEDFPKESFLDYSLYESPEVLFREIQKMSRKEYIYRLNKCIDTYNKFVLMDNVFWENLDCKRLDYLIQACKSLS